MEDKEILVVKKEKNSDKMKFKVVQQQKNQWSPSRYEKIITSHDYNQIAYLLFDLSKMGYNIDKAFAKFKELVNEPELFFLK